MLDFGATFANFAGAFPNYEAVNVSAPGAGDGTEFIAAMVNDSMWGWQQAVLDYAGLTPDGVTEAAGTSQIITAIQRGNGIGPGIGVIYWKNDTPAAFGDRVLLLVGQTVDIATYPELTDAVYVGDADNPTAPAFFKCTDAGDPTGSRNTAGTLLYLPDTRGLSLKGVGDAVVNDRTKTGPVELGEVQEDQGQGWQLGATEDATGARDYWGAAAIRDHGTSYHESTNASYPTLRTTHQGLGRMLKAMNDGTNDDPRTGLATRDSTIGTRYGITY